MATEITRARPVKRPGPLTRPGLFADVTHSLVFARSARFLPPCALVLFGLALRVLRLEFQPLWWDEGYTVWFTTHSLSQMVALTASDIHPPLYYALLHGWSLLLGTGPVALRLFSVAAGTLTIPLIYVLAHRLCGRSVAWLAALLLAANPLHVFYSQEVRMYGLVTLLATATLYAAWNVFAHEDRLPRHRDWRLELAEEPAPLLPYVLLAAAALYTQYYAAFLPLGLTTYALWHWRHHTRALVRWLLAQLAVVLLYLPWLLYATPKLIPYIANKVTQDADRPLGLLPYLGRHLAAYMAGHLEGTLTPYWPLTLLLLVPLIYGVYLAVTGQAAHLERFRRPIVARHDKPALLSTHRGGLRRRSSANPLGLLGTVLTAILLAGFAVSRSYPFFPERGERLLLLGLPVFLVLASTGIEALKVRLRPAGFAMVGLIGVAAAFSLYSFYTVPRYAGDDYRPLIAHTVEQGLPGDTVFCVYPWQVGYWRSYGSPNGPEAVLTPSAAWGPEVAAALDGALARGHVWFPEHLSLGALLEHQAERYLGGKARLFGNQWYGPGTRLSAWTLDRKEDEPTGAAAVQFTLSDAPTPLTLASVRAAAGPVPAANQVLPLTLAWNAGAAPSSTLAVSVRLVDDLGQMWAQHDYSPLGGLAPADDSGQPAAGSTTWDAEDRIGLLVPAGTPPGQYQVEITVHPATDDRPLEAKAADGKVVGNAAPLFRVEVTAADRSVTPERLPIAQRQAVDLADGLRFLGYSMDQATLRPGDLRRISLFWQADARPANDYVAFVQLLDGQGRMVAGAPEAAPGAAYATSQWAPSSLIRSQMSFRPPPDLPDGRYRLIAGLFRRSDGVRLRTASGADYLSLGTVTVRGRAHVMTPPQPAHPANAQFGETVRLVGYDFRALEDGDQKDQKFAVILSWQATGTMGQAYSVFVHALDQEGKVRGYGDGEPGSGQYPTTSWLSGEYLTDRHTVTVEPAAGAGSYRVAVGVYDPATGQRLLLPDGKDQLVLDTPVTLPFASH